MTGDHRSISSLLCSICVRCKLLFICWRLVYEFTQKEYWWTVKDFHSQNFIFFSVVSLVWLNSFNKYENLSPKTSFSWHKSDPQHSIHKVWTGLGACSLWGPGRLTSSPPSTLRQMKSSLQAPLSSDNITGCKFTYFLHFAPCLSYVLEKRLNKISSWIKCWALVIYE